ncbi:hypothetical protein PVK06_008706 [Gossypium arboreum]|uniref:Uncharacterized protein n=1 Tax=Gossypium arboreum TaxID=29729 RepID=A0ABR0QKN3_GOSAR|nr:hypothetical protein PVK06_008706 [Gossypium arboreum]
MDLICDDEGNDPMVISTTIAGFEVKIILVDSGSVMEVLTLNAYKKMGLKEYALKKVSPFIWLCKPSSQVKQNWEQEPEGQSSQQVVVAIQVLDLDSLDVRSEERICKPEIT